MQKFYVYRHIRKDTNSIFYVGKGNGNRCKRHNGRNRYWKSIVQKANGFDVEFIVKDIDEELAFLVEQEAIDAYKRFGFSLANISAGGEGTSGMKHTQEAKDKVSKANKGKKKTEQQKKLISIQSTGRKHSEETKAYLSAINKNRVLTEEQKQKIIDAHKGRKLTEETKQKISKKHLALNKTMSAEHRKTISDLHKGKKQSPEQISKRIQARLDTLAKRKQMNQGALNACH